MQTEDVSDKKVERSKALALDEKVSKKLTNIINRIHDHGSQVPTTTKAASKEQLDFTYLKNMGAADEV